VFYLQHKTGSKDQAKGNQSNLSGCRSGLAALTETFEVGWVALFATQQLLH